MSLLRHHQLLMSGTLAPSAVVVASSINPSTGSPVASRSMTVPVGTLPGDIMVCMFTLGNHLRTPIPPGGWTMLTSAAVSTGVYIYTRVAGISEPSAYTFSCAGGSTYLATLCVSVRNASSATAGAFSHIFTDSPSQSEQTTPTVPAQPGAVALGFFANEPGGGTYTATPTAPAVILQLSSSSLSQQAAAAAPVSGATAGPIQIKWSTGTATPNCVMVQVY